MTIVLVILLIILAVFVLIQWNESLDFEEKLSKLEAENRRHKQMLVDIKNTPKVNCPRFTSEQYLPGNSCICAGTNIQLCPFNVPKRSI